MYIVHHLMDYGYVQHSIRIIHQPFSPTYMESSSGRAYSSVRFLTPNPRMLFRIINVYFDVLYSLVLSDIGES